MYFKQPDLTAGSRPILEQDESLLFVQNSVGLYEGKYKIAGCQNGHAYLTSHRACYIDDTDPRKNSLAIDLCDVDRHDYQAGFLRSSPKVTLHPKPLKGRLGSLGRHLSVSQSVQRLQSASSPTSRTASPFRHPNVPTVTTPTYTGNWTCPICSFHNPVPSNFNPANEDFPLPPCLTCGIKPPFTVVLKAAIAAGSNRAANTETSAVAGSSGSTASSHSTSVGVDTSTCIQCTFRNHPSLQYCEICGSPLPRVQSGGGRSSLQIEDRTQSPGPEISTLKLDDKEEISIVKFSFRAGGDKVFSDRLKSALIQRKWLVTSAPPIPRPLDNLKSAESPSSGTASPERSGTPRSVGVGIAGLEQRGLQSRRNNEAVIGTAFEDLEALMASAREIVALAEKFSTESRASGTGPDTVDPFLSESAAAVGIVATKDMLSSNTNKLYVSELARTLAEFVIDERRGILRGQGGVMSLVDLWATYNRSRNGVELVSPSDCHKAAEMWSALGLPVKLRQFRSGLLVVQQQDRSDEKTISQIKRWFEVLRTSPKQNVEWDWSSFVCGVTAQDAAQKFGWSLGVATEELEMAEERGALCREDGVQGLRFWLNCLVDE